MNSKLHYYIVEYRDARSEVLDEGSKDAGAGFLEREGKVFQAGHLPQAKGQRGLHPSRGPWFRDGKTLGARSGPGIRGPTGREAITAMTFYYGSAPDLSPISTFGPAGEKDGVHPPVFA